MTGYFGVRRERAKANRMNRVNGLGGSVHTMSQRFHGAVAPAVFDGAMYCSFGRGTKGIPCLKWTRAAKP